MSRKTKTTQKGISMSKPNKAIADAAKHLKLKRSAIHDNKKAAKEYAYLDERGKILRLFEAQVCDGLKRVICVEADSILSCQCSCGGTEFSIMGLGIYARTKWSVCRQCFTRRLL
jgi:hypothetical protein